MNINLSLLARLHAIEAAFNRDEFKDIFASAPGKINVPNPSNFNEQSLKDLVKKDDEEGKGGDGGGGTMKGLRGKHDAHAKAVNAARRLGR